MNVHPIDPHNRRAVNRFIDFPHQHYRDNPYWVPELHSSARLVFDQKRHPFYRHSTAQFFLAQNQNEVVGRIAVLHNHNYSAHYQQEVGFFYNFDLIDDQEVAKGLLDAAVLGRGGRASHPFWVCAGFSALRVLVCGWRVSTRTPRSASPTIFRITRPCSKITAS